MIIRRRDIDQPLPGKRHHGCRICLIIPEVIGDTKSSPDHQCRHRQSVPQQCPEIRLYEIACFPVTCLHGVLMPFFSTLIPTYVPCYALSPSVSLVPAIQHHIRISANLFITFGTTQFIDLAAAYSGNVFTLQFCQMLQNIFSLTTADTEALRRTV